MGNHRGCQKRVETPERCWARAHSGGAASELATDPWGDDCLLTDQAEKSHSERRFGSQVLLYCTARKDGLEMLAVGNLCYGDLTIGADDLLRDLVSEMITVLRLPIGNLLLHHGMIDVDQDRPLRMLRMIGGPGGQHPFFKIVRPHAHPGGNTATDLRACGRDGAG